MRLRERTSPTPACPSLAPKLRPVSLDRGIWIGTATQDLYRKLGKPSAMRDEWLTFNFLGTTPGRYRGPGQPKERIVNWDVTNILEARMSAGRVDSLWVSKVTSY